MIFWLAILAGALFAWFAFKLGFYDTLAILFNIVIAVYVAVFLTPIIVDFIPAAAQTPYGNALTLIAVAAAVFFILFGISYTFITGQFGVSFPKIFDVLVSPLLGFLIGSLLLSFAALLIGITPISQNKFADAIGLNRYSQQANISYICWWCDLVHNIVSTEDGPKSTARAIDWYWQNVGKKARKKSIEQASPNQPTDANAPSPAPTNRRMRRASDKLLPEIDDDAGQD